MVNIPTQDYSRAGNLSENKTYQTKFIGIGVLGQVLGQTPIGHPRVHKRERRGVGTRPKETGYIWMLQSPPHDRTGAQSLHEPKQKTESIGGVLKRRVMEFLCYDDNQYNRHCMDR